jgi:membrane-associated phospholipid phosphatase
VRAAAGGASAALALALLAPATAAAASTSQRLGDVGQIALPATGLVVAALHHDGKGVLQLAESLGATMAVVYVLKPTVDRTRPNGGSQSFPSGHTASAFSGAAFLQLRYGWAYGVPACAAAAYVGWSRVHAKQHWTSDVLAGGALGIGGALAFTRRYHKLVLQPVAGRRELGLFVHAAW